MFRDKIVPNKALAPGGIYYRQPCYRRRVTGHCFFLTLFSLDSEATLVHW